MKPWPHIRRLLRSPKIIIGEIAALFLFGAVGAVQSEWHVFSSVWFVVLAAITSLSLIVVVCEQIRRLRTGWAQQLTVAHFTTSPLRAEFDRPATDSRRREQIWSERRLGLAGSFVFHSGLLLIILAGMLRALFATEAVTDVVENEPVPPQAAAWLGQFPGVAARPFSLDREIKLLEVKSARYPAGDLRSLSLRIAVAGVARQIEVNQELRIGGSRIFPGREFGPAALVEWTQAGMMTRHAVLLHEQNADSYEGELAGARRTRVFLRSHLDRAGSRPGEAEVRVMDGGALLATAVLPVGGSLSLPDGGKISLCGLPCWARLQGSRDYALGLAYIGMIFTMLGAAMMFCLVKLDYCLVVTPLGDREKVFVALKPQRFAPLFQERFEKLVCELKSQQASKVGPAALGQSVVAHPQSGASGLPRPALGFLARTTCWLLLGAGLVFNTGCDRISSSQARGLVERYNQAVSEAYRRGDVRLIDSVVGPTEGKKLTGLIGVRLDIGITLDSQLLSLDVIGVEQKPNELLIRTKEKWSYRDLKIGSGEQVGQASEDFYEMTYYFTNINKTWLVDEIKFAATPQVGRTNTPWVAERSAMHGVTTLEAAP